MEAVVVHHLLLALGARYDLDDPVTPYSLNKLAFTLRQPGGASYPALANELWLFARLQGEGDCELWAEVFRVAEDEDAEDELVGAYGPYLVRFGADPNAVSRAWCLRGVPFPTPGWYEFRLTQAGDVVGVEHLFLEE